MKQHNFAAHSHTFGLLVTYCMLGLFTVFAIYPLVWLFINSFKTTQEFYLNRLGLPGNIAGYGWTLTNFKSSWVAGHFPFLS